MKKFRVKLREFDLLKKEKILDFISHNNSDFSISYADLGKEKYRMHYI